MKRRIGKEFIGEEDKDIVQVLSLYSFGILLFVFGYYLQFAPMVFLPRAIGGFIAFIGIPGLLLTRLVLQKQNEVVAYSLVCGLAFSLINVHLFFLFVLVSGIQLLLAVWLIVSTSLLVALFGIYAYHEKPHNPIFGLSLDEYPRSLLWIIVIGIAFRVVLAVASLGAIAPDATLYADYARSIVDGQFQSNVSNDSAVYNLWNNRNYVSHQGFTYVFALSWILLPPTSSGPTLLLTIFGLLLVFPTYSVVQKKFGQLPAEITSLIVAIQPIFVFHSCVAYGPEITSLVFMIFAMKQLCEGGKPNTVNYVTAGVLIGLVDVIWFANFFLFCAVFPVVLLFTKRKTRNYSLIFLVCCGLSVASRTVITELSLYLLVIGSIFFVLLISKRVVGQSQIHKSWPFFTALVFIIALWRWPFLFDAISSSTGTAVYPGYGSLIGVLTGALNPAIVPGFLLFITLHLTPCVLVAVILTFRYQNWREGREFVIAALFASLGTLLVFGHFSKETLLPIYFFADSRYFLFTTLMLVIFSGAYFSEFFQRDEFQVSKSILNLPKNKRNRAIKVITVLVLGMIPAYAAVPSGIGLVSFEDRYGWQGLNSKMETIGEEDSVFLADRARELCWFTNRKTYVLSLSSEELPDRNASQEILALRAESSAEYLIVDDYTIAHWKTLEYLYSANIDAGEAVILNTTRLIDYSGSNMTSVASLQLVAETEPNRWGRYARVFRFAQADFSETESEDMLDSGWAATNNGVILNSSSKAKLVIGNGSEYTNTWRFNRFDLDRQLSNGLIEIRFSALTAEIARIGIWDASGDLLGYANEINETVYCAVLGEVLIGDIRIVIEGDSGDYAVIQEVSYWEHQS